VRPLTQAEKVRAASKLTPDDLVAIRGFDVDRASTAEMREVWAWLRRLAGAEQDDDGIEVG
jgi:hypothetical protein